jgi:nucleotide-binding universal stress UspA family protein
MANPQKVLVAYYGSPNSNAALGWALLLGSEDNAELEMIKVVEPISQAFARLSYDYSGAIDERYAMIKNEDHKMLTDAKVFCGGSSKFKVHMGMLTGKVASIILDYAKQRDFDIIVSGTKEHGVLHEMLVGSFTNSLVNLAKIPVLVVKEQKVSAKLQKILVAYDGSDSSKAALELAIDIGKSADAKIMAVKVADPVDYMKFYMGEFEYGTAMSIKAILGEMDEAEKEILDGARSAALLKGMEIVTVLLPVWNIADMIIRYAGKNKVDMIVAGTIGQGLKRGLLMGSVTRNLISLSTIPVLVVKK